MVFAVAVVMVVVVAVVVVTKRIVCTRVCVKYIMELPSA
jgi:hypothetical protein